MSISPFDYAKIINLKLINEVPDGLSAYDPFMMNRIYSNIPDTVFYANLINVDCDPQYNFDFYYHALPKGKRYGKWYKKQKSAAKTETHINNITEHYNCSKTKAQEIYDILVNYNLLNDFLSEIDKGGKSK